MSINLNKGSRFNLQKASPGLIHIGVGLGWDPNETPGGPAFDLDASAFMVGNNYKIPADGYFVFYGNQISADAAVRSSGDDQTGGNSDTGDDETLFLDLPNVSPLIEQIVFTATICKYPNDSKKDIRTKELNFGMVNNCYIRIFNQDNEEELLKYNLKEKFNNEDALEFGRLYRTGDSWEFEAMGRGSIGSLEVLVEMYT
ncbi:MAG: TerD family protein [Bacteroidetes bacterium]|nr:TerD family protein [Bacteroidota bacterium]